MSLAWEVASCLVWSWALDSEAWFESGSTLPFRAAIRPSSGGLHLPPHLQKAGSIRVT